MARTIYLDYAAATPLEPKVLAAMQPFWGKDFYNPSATYLAARRARQALEAARADIAKRLGAKASEVVFTAGATEANNLAIQGVMRQFPDAEVLVSAVEHDSVLAPAALFKHQQIPVSAQGRLELDALDKAITAKTVLISLMLVNNELGTLQPLRETASLVRQHLSRRRAQGSQLPLYLHTDAAQAPNYLSLQTARLGVDLLTINGSKIYGPKQIGVLFIKSGVKLRPLILGGGQERGLRSGTENVAAAVGLAKALDLAQQNRPAETQRVSQLKAEFIKTLSQKEPAAVINGSTRQTAPHIVNASFPDFDNERLMMALDEQGIICATGSACSAAGEELSHVLRAIGLNDSQISSSLRFSFGRQTTSTDITKTAEVLKSLTT